MQVATDSVQIGLEAGCCDSTLPNQLYTQLSGGGYTWPMSVIPLSQHPDEYVQSLRTARKRAEKARRRGYQFDVFERCDYERDVNDINRSKPIRQGRPMSNGYMKYQRFSPIGEQPCRRHSITQYGVFEPTDTLVAYSVVIRCGQLALVSQILGHGDKEHHGIMQLLGVEVYRSEFPCGGFLVYNRHDSGGEGLIQAKEWLRYQPMRIEWQR